MPHSLKMARISEGTPLVSPVADARERHGQGCLPISHFLGTGPGALPSPYSTQSGGKNSHLNSPPLSSPTGIRYQVSGVVEVPGFRYEGSGITNVEDPEVLTRPWTMNPRVSVRTTKELLVENPPCVELDIDQVTSFDEKTKR